MTSRFLRNLAAFCFGIALGGLLVFWSASASAALWSNASGSVIITRNSQGVPTTLRFPTTEYANVAGGGVTVGSSATANIGTALGASVPVALPVAVKQTLTPANIAGAVVGSGGNVPGAILQLAAPLLAQAAMQYANDHWIKTPTSDETSATNLLVVEATNQTTQVNEAAPYLYSQDTSSGTSVAAVQSHWMANNPGYGCVTVSNPGNPPALGTVVSSYFYWGCKDSKGTSYSLRMNLTAFCPAGQTKVGNGHNGYNCQYTKTEKVCAANQNWTLTATSTGDYCTRPACVGDEIRDTSDGVCKSSVLTTAQAVDRLTPAVTSYPDPASLVHAWPKDIDPDPNNTFPTPQVSGPSSVTSDKQSTTTTTPANGSTPASTTTTNTWTTVNNTYNNTTVTTTVTNTTEVVKDGVVVSTTTDGGKPDPTKDDNATVNDTEMPDLPKLYERKYPDGLVGVWNAGIGAIKAMPLFSLPQVFAPTNIDSGTCPSWNLDLNIGPKMMWGIRDVAPPCSIWPAIKIIMIICSLMLARALVFGG